MVDAAYPFIEVSIDTSGLTPPAQRSPGVIAVVGTCAGDMQAGTELADVNVPIRIDTLDDAFENFSGLSTDGLANRVETNLYSALKIAMLQDPKPSKIYGVRVDGTNYSAALSSLEAADDVTFVSLAHESASGPLTALKTHVESVSTQGQKRLGVAMVNPGQGKVSGYVDYISGTVPPAITAEEQEYWDNNVASLISSTSRMVMIAARGAITSRATNARDNEGEIVTEEETYTPDVATAAMAAMAGYEPHISLVLKKIRGFRMPLESQYSPSEVKGLSEANIIPIIDPDLIVGKSLHFAEGRCYTADESLLYVDIVRTLDDIEFRLKAGLMGLIGDARITKTGMTRLKSSVEGILGPLKRRGVIVDFAIDIPVLSILNIPPSAWNAADKNIVETARANRMIEFMVTVTYGPAVHRLKIKLTPTFGG